MPRKKTSARAQPAQTNGYARTRQDHAQELSEDYVELIDTLIREKGEARAVDLAARLGVTHVTVTKTIRRLKAEGLVTSEPYRSIFLTTDGQKLANHSRKRHEIVLDFLLALGVPEVIASVDSEGIEHHVSPRTLDAMKRFIARTST